VVDEVVGGVGHGARSAVGVATIAYSYACGESDGPMGFDSAWETRASSGARPSSGAAASARSGYTPASCFTRKPPKDTGRNKGRRMRNERARSPSRYCQAVLTRNSPTQVWTSCPLNKVNRRWSDRMKVVEEPLFKSYVFVHVTDAERSGVRMVDGVLNFVYWNGKPAIVKDEEIMDIRRFLNEHMDVRLESIELAPESKVLIRSGVMMNMEATVRRVFPKRVEVVIESLGYKLVAHVDKSNLRPLS